jgi:hypothetical protein
MALKDFASVSGKPGLWKVIKPARTGLILESYDDKKTKLITGPNHRVSVLDEISVYTNDVDKTIPLQEIFQKIFDEFAGDPGVDTKSDADELRAFMEHVAPDHDTDRVYGSDIKKIVGWYLILFPLMPGILEKEKEKEEEADKTAATSKEKKPADQQEGAKEKAKSPGKSKGKTA